jgi:hypothetical protein
LKKQYQDDGGRGDLTDEQWEKLRPLLPPQKAWTGQPAADHRRIVNGILWLHRTGPPWRDIPAERYGIIERFPVGSISGEKGCVAKMVSGETQFSLTLL